jgi:hypothetical protein
MWWTDGLARYYWLEHWYGDCVGIVEYLGEWVRDYSTPEDAKKIGLCAVIVLAMLVGWYGAEFMKRPKNGDTIWKKLFNKEE